MSHPAAEILDLYLDDQLDAGARATVAAHLSTCPACQAELAAVQDLFRELETLPADRLPRDLTAPVLARIAPARSWRAALAAALLGAQVALTGLLALWIGPTLAGWAGAVTTLPEPPAVDPAGALAAGWALATAQLQSLLNSPGPAPDLLAGIGPQDWALLVAAAGGLWLLGNRLLLAAPPEARR
ncbi:MAG TPA: zf-HC2 domain-containing protein [Chloroflexia bacterium]|nr:zf-HC2 domain-containing protein [Chloroflexia bacterium]